MRLPVPVPGTAQDARPGVRPAPCCPPTSGPGRVRDAGTPVATVALVGNPNVGKSTLFNALTGARQHVGNWPGKTVHVATGSWATRSGTMDLVDLPGTYSLVPRSPDEELVRDLLVDHGAAGRPDVVVAVLDAANLARNLYLLAQLFDTGVPVVVALTMMDVAADRGLRIDPQVLARRLGVRVVAVHPRIRRGLDELRGAVATALAVGPPRPVELGEAVESGIAELAGYLGPEVAEDRISPRWLAVNLLAHHGPDEHAHDGGAAGRTLATLAVAHAPLLRRLREEIVARLAATPATAAPATDDLETEAPETGDLETVVAERLYAWVHGVVVDAVRRPDRDRPTTSDRVDRVLTSRWLGLPLFLLVMWGVFEATTRLAAPLQAGLGWLIDGPVRGAVAWALARVGLGDTWVAGLVLDGLVSGVGQLLTFVPLMTIMFVLLTLLEDSGYMARAAFVADRFLRLVGLPGRAFLPLIVGFGCNVPAIAGSRILPDARHRLLTTLLVPFVSCSARLTVYVLLADVFFGRHAGTVVFGMYVLSVALVVSVGIALRHTVFRRQPREGLLLELPPYRRPAARVVLVQTWQKLAGFLRTASGIIVATVGVVWLLAAIPVGGGDFGRVDTSHSLYAGVSRAVSPVFAPAGFADWHATGALLTGFVAKEAVVSTFAQTYNAPEPADAHAGGALADQLRATFDRTSGGHPTPAVLAFLVFLLAYTPCMATLAAQRAEVGGRWTLAGVGLQLAVAWTLATLVFQIGRLLT